ncbi:MAG: sugar phosphate isomerase/epimerase, partial [Blautia sp.]|nr:sugar phosphate isomerase/epimerase [Blautia sp.]
MGLSMGRVAAMNIQYRYYPLDRFLDDAVSCGLTHIELWGAAPFFHLEDMSYLQVKAVREKIETRGLHLVCLTPEQCIYPINLAAPTREERFRSLKFFENHLRAACELGAEKMLITSGWGYFDNSNHDEAWKWAREGIYDLAELAKVHGIKLALEVLRRDESNLVYNLPTLLQMLEELRHPNVGGMIDTIPMALAGESPADYVKALGKNLIHVHFIDGAPRGHLAWGDG